MLLKRNGFGYRQDITEKIMKVQSAEQNKYK